MRIKKPRGKKPGVISLTEKDVLRICSAHLAEDFNLGSMCFIKLDKKKSKVEFAFEFEDK